MKKFLALLFVCAGMTAMAAPHMNKAELPKAVNGQMVMKANTLTNELTHSMVSKDFMAGAKKNVQRVSKDLVNKRAPRRLSDAEIINNPYVCFLYKCHYNADYSGYVEADPFFAGSGAYWYPDVSEGLYFAGFYWDANGSTYYLPLDIDYNTGEVALSWGILLENDSTIGTARTRTDTITWIALMSEAYYLNDEQQDCMGTLYNDGSIIFDDNYVYGGYQILRNYRNNRLTSTDTIIIEDVFVGTEILAANGRLDYIQERDGAAASSDVYMFQDADTVFVGNPWNYGMPNVPLVLNNQGKAVYECATIDETDGMTYLFNPIWDIDDTWISGGLGLCYGVGGYTTTEDGYIDEFLWGFEGDATPDEITWDYTAATNGYHLFYGYNNNKLYWLNGDKFVIPGGDFVRGDVNGDELVTIDDVTAFIDALLSDNFDIFGEGADCNEDGEYTIDDVTALIDFQLSGAW